MKDNKFWSEDLNLRSLILEPVLIATLVWEEEFPGLHEQDRLEQGEIRGEKTICEHSKYKVMGIWEKSAYLGTR